MKNNIREFLFLVFLTASIFNAYGHHPDNSLIYLRIYETNGIEGRFDIHINELNEVLGLNLEKNPNLETVRPHLDKIRAYLLENTQFSSVYGNHGIVFIDKLDRLKTTFGAFIQFYFKLENSEKVPDDLEVTFKTFIEESPGHVNLLAIEYNWKAGMINNEALIALDFSKNDWTKSLSLTDTSVWKGFQAMIKQGIWHIWIGLDHILFLLALILPSVVRRIRAGSQGNNLETAGIKGRGYLWKPVERFKPAFIYIVKVVTFFTIAHTITLTLASLNIINLPSRLVEAVIALSIGLAAYHNIRPIFKGRDWVIAFVFGLFHGFGFASVLGELGVTGEFLTLSLLGFNIGVEIGQVVIIVLIFPVLFFLRKSRFYSKLLLYLSILLIIISLYWFVERAFDINIPLDENIRSLGGRILRWIGILPPLPG
ncbi:MAG: HupE/UreJ family protein [Aurantibacter sp.]